MFTNDDNSHLAQDIEALNVEHDHTLEIAPLNDPEVMNLYGLLQSKAMKGMMLHYIRLPDPKNPTNVNGWFERQTGTGSLRNEFDPDEYFHFSKVAYLPWNFPLEGSIAGKKVKVFGVTSPKRWFNEKYKNPDACIKIANMDDPEHYLCIDIGANGKDVESLTLDIEGINIPLQVLNYVKPEPEPETEAETETEPEAKPEPASEPDTKLVPEKEESEPSDIETKSVKTEPETDVTDKKPEDEKPETVDDTVEPLMDDSTSTNASETPSELSALSDEMSGEDNAADETNPVSDPPVAEPGVKEDEVITDDPAVDSKPTEDTTEKSSAKAATDEPAAETSEGTTPEKADETGDKAAETSEGTAPDKADETGDKAAETSEETTPEKADDASKPAVTTLAVPKTKEQILADAIKDVEHVYIPAELLSHIYAYKEGRAHYSTINHQFYRSKDPQTFNSILLQVDDINNVPKIVTAMQEERGYSVIANTEQIDNMQEMDSFLNMLIGVIAVCVLAFGLITVISTMNDSTERKRGMIGILRVMGVSKFGIFFFVLLRSCIIAVFAAILMMLFGTLIAMTCILLGTAGVLPSSVLVIFTLKDVLLVIGGILGCCILGSLIPAWSASRIDPIQVVQEGRFK